MHLVDVFNMIEAFRENGLNTLDHNTELHATRLEAIVSSIFYALNKRLPTTHYIDVERSISLVTNWLLYAYDRWLFYFGDWLVASMLVLALRFFLNCQCSSLANPIMEGYVLLVPFYFLAKVSFHRMPSNFFFQSFSLCTTLTFLFFVCCTKLEKIKCNNHQ